jgi:hypothetical protein
LVSDGFSPRRQSPASAAGRSLQVPVDAEDLAKAYMNRHDSHPQYHGYSAAAPAKSGGVG